MALLPILEFPDPRLRTQAAQVDAAQVVTPEFQALLDDMFETMYQAPGIGLAATQVDRHLRFMVIDVSEGKDAPMVFINPDVVSRALEEHGDRVVVGVDVKNGGIAVRGWTEGAAADPLELGRRWAAAGVRSFVYTEVSRDGVMTGIDLKATSAFARATGGNVIASGGVGSLDHLRLLKTVAGAGIEGVIIGRALYEKAFTLAEAQSIFAAERGEP